MDTAAVALAPENEVDTDVVSQQTARLVREIGIPPCPKVLVDFMAEANKDDPDFRRLSHLINKDVALAAAVLKTINSPFYGSTQKARTVHEALTRIGLRQATRLIAGLLLRQAFASSKSPAMYEYWDSSAKIALISAYLARELETGKLDEAHTFALFRDCGIPVLLTRYPEYEPLLAAAAVDDERQRSDMESAHYGFDHAVVGATLAQSWHLPIEMCQLIRVHNAYDQPDFRAKLGTDGDAQLVALGLLAEQCYRNYRGTFDAENWVSEEAFVAATLGPVHDRLEPLSNDIARILQQT